MVQVSNKSDCIHDCDLRCNTSLNSL